MYRGYHAASAHDRFFIGEKLSSSSVPSGLLQAARPVRIYSIFDWFNESMRLPGWRLFPLCGMRDSLPFVQWLHSKKREPSPGSRALPLRWEAPRMRNPTPRHNARRACRGSFTATESAFAGTSPAEALRNALFVPALDPADPRDNAPATPDFVAAAALQHRRRHIRTRRHFCTLRARS